MAKEEGDEDRRGGGSTCNGEIQNEEATENWQCGSINGKVAGAGLQAL